MQDTTNEYTVSWGVEPIESSNLDVGNFTHERGVGHAATLFFGVVKLDCLHESKLTYVRTLTTEDIVCSSELG